MRNYLILIILLSALLPSFAFAQDAKEDVIYLKNGTVYHGTIIEQIPGVSFKIEILGGSVIVIKADEIEKVTKETKTPETGQHAYTKEELRNSRGRGRAVKGTLGYKDKGGFFEAQFTLMYIGTSIKVVGGYKINQYAMVGLGIGMGGTYAGATTHGIYGDPSPYSGQYFPIFIHYSGDILKKNITPFYELDAGYAFASNIAAYFFNPNPYYYGGIYNKNTGGPMGNAGFGVRMYIGRTFTLTMSANLNIQYAGTEVDNYPNGYNQPSVAHSHTTLLLPGIKIGLGLVK